MSSEVSREKPVNYEAIFKQFLDNRGDKGYILWVIGPALVHARGREAMEWLSEGGALDDAAYAFAYGRNAIEKGKSSARIRAELKARGVETNDIEAGLCQVLPDADAWASAERERAELLAAGDAGRQSGSCHVVSPAVSHGRMAAVRHAEPQRLQSQRPGFRKSLQPPRRFGGFRRPGGADPLSQPQTGIR